MLLIKTDPKVALMSQVTIFQWGLSRVDFGTLQVIYSGFFLPKIVPEERGYCEKQSQIIVIYVPKYGQNI